MKKLHLRDKRVRQTTHWAALDAIRFRSGNHSRYGLYPSRAPTVLLYSHSVYSLSGLETMTPVAASFDDLYKTYAGPVYRVCLRAVSRREVAEELTSEVFLALHQSWTKLSPEQLPAWLFTVAKRRAADYWRHHYVEESWVSAQVEEINCPQFEYPLADLLARCTALKPIHRVCITLRFSQGMSRAEIAQQLNLSELQVKGHLQYALQLLRQQMLEKARPETETGGDSLAELDA